MLLLKTKRPSMFTWRNVRLANLLISSCLRSYDCRLLFDRFEWKRRKDDHVTATVGLLLLLFYSLLNGACAVSAPFCAYELIEHTHCLVSVRRSSEDSIRRDRTGSSDDVGGRRQSSPGEMRRRRFTVRTRRVAVVFRFDDAVRRLDGR